METSGISTGSNLALTAQKAANSDVKTDAAKQPESVEAPFLSQLERLGADHPMTKFLGSFFAQHVDTEA